jgi:AmmeMemoRadiSam system protein A
VIDRAISAAVHDPRFPKVNYEELKDIKIEISILTAPEKILFHSPDDLLAKLRPKIDGVILKTKYGSSTFLPQVWDQIPDKEQFLSYLCRKQGAPGMIWKSNYQDIEVLIYQAIVFGEETYGGIGKAENGQWKE